MKRINESFVELTEESLSSFISSKVNACDREVRYIYIIIHGDQIKKRHLVLPSNF